MSSNAVRLGLLLALMLSASQAQAEEKKIVVQGKFGQVVSNATSKPGTPDDLELSQEVRVDTLTSADPDWDGATVTVYEQSLAYPSHGNYRSYCMAHTKSGDLAYFELAGTWEIITHDGKYEGANFEASGKFVGGTGKLEGLTGTIVGKGKVGEDQGGTYSAEITASR